MTDFYLELRMDGIVTGHEYPTESYSLLANGQYRHYESERTQVYLIGACYTEQKSKDSELLGLTVDGNPDSYKFLDGHFSIVLVDKHSARVRLVNNKVGGYRLYYATLSDRLIISTSLLRLKAEMEVSEIDSEALREVLIFRRLTSDKSLLKNVSQIQAGEYHDINGLKLISIKAYWRFPVRQDSNNSMEDHCKNVNSLLCRAIRSSIPQGTKVAVLLSGGVDSSVLAALTKSQDIEFTAISHQTKNFPNPELETAIEFASCLGVEHRIIDVADEEIADLFLRTTCYLEQPPRTQSSLIVCKLFEELQNEFSHVLYGEAADTLFGSNMVNRYRKRLIKKTIFSNRILGAVLAIFYSQEKISTLRTLTPVNHFMKEAGLSLNESDMSWINAKTPDYDFFNYSSALIEDSDNSNERLRQLTQLKALSMRSDVNNHFHETYALARQFNLELASPFAHYEVMDYASRIKDEHYFGKDFVKPILRKIGEQYFPNELMYLPKKGFPTPHEHWLNNELSGYWQQAADRFGIEDLNSHEIEFKWTVASLSILMDHFDLKKLHD